MKLIIILFNLIILHVRRSLTMRNIKPHPGHFYHIYNRGINHENIFLVGENWGFFLQRIRYYFKPSFADVISYCLMPNHFHLLVLIKVERFGNKVMQPFSVSYTKAVNNQIGRNGPLFQGPYKAQLVNKDSYLLHLTRYIHLNPVSAGLVSNPEKWVYSSYRDYVGIREGTLPVMNIILDQFPNSKAYADFVCSELDSKDFIPKTLLYD